MKKIPPIHRHEIVDKNCNQAGNIKWCCFHNCEAEGVHPAPKPHPHTRERYWFCLEHIRRYNASWNYFAHMDDSEVEHYQRTVASGHRPTWKMGVPPSVAKEQILNKVFAMFSNQEAAAIPTPAIPAAEREALAVLDLTYPVTLAAIKARYKKLVKLHHPDVNNNDKSAQEKFITVNKAYTYLLSCGYFK